MNRSYQLILDGTVKHLEALERLAASWNPALDGMQPSFGAMAQGACSLWYALALDMALEGGSKAWDEFQADHARLDEMTKRIAMNVARPRSVRGATSHDGANQ